MEFDVDSPCVRNCCLDDNNVCLGCFRTVQEIIDWGETDDAGKRHVLKLAEERRQQHREKYAK